MSVPAGTIENEEAFWAKVPGAASACRRGVPRVHANVRGQIKFEDGQVRFVTNDLSLGGLQIGCSGEFAARLSPQGAIDPEQAFEVALALDMNGKTAPVLGRAKVVHLHRVPGADPSREVAVGLRFERLAEGSDRALMRFIEFHMHPAGF